MTDIISRQKGGVGSPGEDKNPESRIDKEEVEYSTEVPVGRLGGDEFEVLLPETGKGGALKVAERIRKTICEHPFESKETQINVSISVGVASYPDDAQTEVREKEKEELRRTKIALERNVRVLREKYNFENIIGESEKLLNVLQTVAQVSVTDVPVRVIKQGEIQKVGTDNPRKIDVRVVAATNVDLKKLVDKGSFREDLYHRLNVMPILLPPLRDRKEDIIPLLDNFLNKISIELGVQKAIIENEAVEALMQYEYPGNIRELENTIRRAIIISGGNPITLNELPKEITAQIPKKTKGNAISFSKESLKKAKNKAKESVEKQFVQTLLSKTKGNVTKAAELMGFDLSWLHRLIKKYKIKRKKFKK